MTTNSIILIKIGGSLITDKNKPYSVRKKALSIISKEIKKAQLESGKTLIVGHGGGSFPHVPAKKYQTHLGIQNEASYRGIAEVAMAASQLNQIVLEQLLSDEVNALTFPPHTFILSDNHEPVFAWTEGIEQALKQQQLPLVYGDQMLDKTVGCTIFSTETVLGFLGLQLKQKGYQIERIIHCGQTNGVYDLDGRTIPLISESNFTACKEAIGGSGGTDVTGGMIHKVEETLQLAKQGIPGLIIDGIEHGSLSEAIAGREVLGTRIEA